MGISGGPNLNQDGLVFLYDVFDQDNSYKGEPATNSQNADISSMTQVGFDNWSCYDGSPPYHTWGTNQSKTFVTIPGPFGTSVNAMLYHNFNGGFYGPTDWGAVPNGTITAGRTYTVQGWVRAADSSSIGKTVTPYTYYSHSGGAYSAGTNYTLTDQWQLVSHTHTAQYNASGDGVMYFFTQNSGEVKMHLTMTGVFLDESHAVQWLLGGTTRSATQGLLDVAGANQIDLTNVSFDSNAQILFDGTNDYINIGSGTGINQFSGNFTISLWAMRTAGGNYGNLIGDYYTNSTGTTGEWQIMMGPSSELNLYKVGSGYIISNIASGFSNNTWINVVVTRLGNLVTMYANSNVIATGSDSTSYGTVTGNLNIGIDGNNSSEPFPGNIASISIYKNRALSAQEVLQNYNATKSRFSLK